MEVSDGISNIPPVVELVGDQNKETTQSNSNNADTNSYEAEKVSVTSSQQLQEPLLEFEVNAIPSVPSHDLYLKAIEEMYPTFGTGRLRSNMAFQEDWATTRAVAAQKAFITVKSMITEEKLVYDDGTSLYYDSDESVASYMKKKPKKTNLDDKDKKFFTCLPTCYAMFFAFDSKDAVESYCPFANHNTCWQKRILWNQF